MWPAIVRFPPLLRHNTATRNMTRNNTHEHRRRPRGGWKGNTTTAPCCSIAVPGSISLRRPGGPNSDPRGKFPRTSPNVVRHRTKFEQLPAEFGLTLAESIRDASNLVRTKLGRSLAALGPTRPDSARSRPMSAEFGLESVKCGTDGHWTTVDRCRLTSGKTKYHLAQVSADAGPESMEWWPQVGRARGLHSIQSRPTSAEIGPNGIEPGKVLMALYFVRCWPASVGNCPRTLGVWPSFADSRPMSASVGRNRAESGRFGPMWAGLGQDRPNPHPEWSDVDCGETRFHLCGRTLPEFGKTTAGSCWNLV